MINYLEFKSFIDKQINEQLKLNNDDKANLLNRIKELPFNIKTMGFCYTFINFNQKSMKILELDNKKKNLENLESKKNKTINEINKIKNLKVLIEKTEYFIDQIKELSFLEKDVGSEKVIKNYIDILKSEKDITSLVTQKLLIDKLVILTKYVEIYKMENNL